jgi:AraC-like DNA-binding protein
MKTIHRPFRTNFYLWNGMAALFFSSCVTEPHSHNTMQLLVDLQDGFRCKVSGGEWQSYRLLILRENVIHQLDTRDSVQLLVYLDAGSRIAQQLKARYLKGKDAAAPDIAVLALLNPENLQRALVEPTPELLGQLIGDIFGLLTETQMSRAKDQRMAKVEELIASTSPANLSIRFLSAAIFLSESRLRLLFKLQTGVSIYQYLLWAKVRYGIVQLMAGRSVGEAALEAGFSDSSHFHKMLVQLFGFGPTAFLKSNSAMRMINCDENPLHFETNLYNRQQQLVRTYP